MAVLEKEKLGPALADPESSIVRVSKETRFSVDPLIREIPEVERIHILNTSCCLTANNDDISSCDLGVSRR